MSSVRTVVWFSKAEDERRSGNRAAVPYRPGRDSNERQCIRWPWAAVLVEIFVALLVWMIIWGATGQEGGLTFLSVTRIAAYCTLAVRRAFFAQHCQQLRFDLIPSFGTKLSMISD